MDFIAFAEIRELIFFSFSAVGTFCLSHVFAELGRFMSCTLHVIEFPP